MALEIIQTHKQSLSITRCSFTPGLRECTYRWSALPKGTALHRDPYLRSFHPKWQAVATAPQCPACIRSLHSDIGTLRVVTARELVILSGPLNPTQWQSDGTTIYMASNPGCWHERHACYQCTIAPSMLSNYLCALKNISQLWWRGHRLICLPWSQCSKSTV